MMKCTKMILHTLIFASTIFHSQAKTLTGNDSMELDSLILFLKNTTKDGFLFGHHDDTLYGIGWEGDEERSDVKSVCGDYPSIISFDLGNIELGNYNNLDNVPFSKIHKEIINHYNRGGIVTLSWHLNNPVTLKNAWDVTNNRVVSSILPNGENHQKFEVWMNRLSAFINLLTDEQGKKYL